MNKEGDDFLNNLETPPADVPAPAAAPSEPAAAAPPAPIPAASPPSPPATSSQTPVTPSPTPPVAAPTATVAAPPVGAAPTVPATSTPAPTPPVEEPPPFSVELTAPAASPAPVATPPGGAARLTPEQLVEQLAKSYALDEQTREAYLDNAPEVLPKLLATQHVRVAREVLGTLQKILPGIVSNLVKQGGTRQTFTQKFYGRWPALKPHHKTVENALRVHRALNPGATLEELVEQVGLATSVSLKLPIEGVSPPAATAPAAPAPFTPAAPTAGAPPAPAKSPWEELIEEET